MLQQNNGIEPDVALETSTFSDASLPPMNDKGTKECDILKRKERERDGVGGAKVSVDAKHAV